MLWIKGKIGQEAGDRQMKVYEFGKEHEKTFAMFQCTAEPGWVFKPSAEAMAQGYHVLLFIADGHDEMGTTFVSIEKYASDTAAYLREKGILHLDGLYGVSMGGAAAIRFLAAEDTPVDQELQHYESRHDAGTLDAQR